jgi:sensor histidine kinase regulating citrate/malate metabolism
MTDLWQGVKATFDPGGYANEMRRKNAAETTAKIDTIKAGVIPARPKDVIDVANAAALRALRKKQMASTYLGAPPPTPTPPLKPTTTLLGGK